MIKKQATKKVLLDAGTDLKGSVRTLCQKKETEVYTIFSAKKLAFAQKNIRSLKNLIHKNLEDKWTYSHNNQMQSFAQTINSKANRVKMLAPNKVTKETFPT